MTGYCDEGSLHSLNPNSPHPLPYLEFTMRAGLYPVSSIRPGEFSN